MCKNDKKIEERERVMGKINRDRSLPELTGQPLQQKQRDPGPVRDPASENEVWAST